MAKRAVKPTALKRLERGKVYGADDEPRPRTTEPAKPPHLDPRAGAVWDRIAPILLRVGLLAETHGDMFASLCNIVAKLEVIAEVKADGEFKPFVLYTVVDSAGNEKPQMKTHPALVEERLLHTQLRMFASEFGLSPRGQAGLVAPEKEPDEEGMVD